MTNSKKFTITEISSLNHRIANYEAALAEETNSVARENILKDLYEAQDLLNAGRWPE